MNNFHYCGEKKVFQLEETQRSNVDIALVLSLSLSDVKRSRLTTAQLINSFWIHFVLKGRLYTLKLIYKDLC